MIDPADERAILAISENETLFRFLLSLADCVGARDIHDMVRNRDHRDMLELIQDDILGIRDVLSKSKAIENYLNSGRNHVYDKLYILGMRPTPTHRECLVMLKELKSLYRPIQKWSKRLLLSVDKMIKEGKITRPKASPNKESKHYRAAIETVGKLQSLWFIKRIVLFGSTAAGTERPDSDVDIAVELFIKQTTAIRSVESMVDQLSEKHKVQISLLFITSSSPKRFLSFMNSAGFWEASIELFSRTQLKISFNTKQQHGIIIFPEDLVDIAFKERHTQTGVEDDTSWTQYACLLIKEKNTRGYRYLFFVNNQPVLLSTRLVLMIPKADHRYFRMNILGATHNALDAGEKDFMGRMAAKMAHKHDIPVPVLYQDIQDFANSYRRLGEPEEQTEQGWE